jgi:murein DD-endopeptidase MepM/ murein hydrolase activator NlpD
MMRKVVKVVIFLAFLVSLPFMMELDRVEAKSKARTLRELKNELAGLKAEKKQNETNKANTKNEISSAKNSVSSKQNEIVKNQNRIDTATEESKKLTTEIEEGKEELYNLIEAYQIAQGDNIYLEYIFDATSYEDLIYRYAIIEEVMAYQEEKIEGWKSKIEKNDQLKKELQDREVLLNTQIDNLSSEIKTLNNKLDDYLDIQMDIDDEIKSTQELIEYYEDLGCKLDEDLDECVNVRGDSMFRKPLTKGVVTSYFGYRTHPVTGKKNSYHTGVDIGGNKEGTSIYSMANGTVAKVIKKSSCGGNSVYIHHVVNGKKYTSAYLHLLTINVKVGTKVSNTTVIGTVGGGKGTKAWDKCSTGAHLHLGLGNGWYGSTYTSYSKWVANLLDPKEKLKLPNKKIYWYSR